MAADHHSEHHDWQGITVTAPTVNLSPEEHVALSDFHAPNALMHPVRESLRAGCPVATKDYHRLTPRG